jgi:hypothetical protein
MARKKHVVIGGQTPPASGLLRWSPPTMDGDAVTFNVSGGSGASTIYNAAGKDAYVNITGVITSRLIIRSAKNVRLIGGEIDIDTAWANTNERWGLYFQDCTGIVHVEGLYIHGVELNEGIDLGQITPGQATSPYPDALVLQNCRIIDLGDPSGVFHADAVQCWGGTDALRIDKCTFESQFQNLMLKAESNQFTNIEVQRLNMRGLGTQQAFMLNTSQGTATNLAGNLYCDGPVTFGGDGTTAKRVYAEKPLSSASGNDFGHNDFGRIATPTYTFTGNGTIPVSEKSFLSSEGGVNYVHWPNSTVPAISGRVWEGPPPSGDYCTTSDCGMAYTSPGYQ